MLCHVTLSRPPHMSRGLVACHVTLSRPSLRLMATRREIAGPASPPVPPTSLIHNRSRAIGFSQRSPDGGISRETIRRSTLSDHIKKRQNDQRSSSNHTAVTPAQTAQHPTDVRAQSPTPAQDQVRFQHTPTIRNGVGAQSLMLAQDQVRFYHAPTIRDGM